VGLVHREKKLELRSLRSPVLRGCSHGWRHGKWGKCRDSGQAGRLAERLSPPTWRGTGRIIRSLSSAAALGTHRTGQPPRRKGLLDLAPGANTPRCAPTVRLIGGIDVFDRLDRSTEQNLCPLEAWRPSRAIRQTMCLECCNAKGAEHPPEPNSLGSGVLWLSGVTAGVGIGERHSLPEFLVHSGGNGAGQGKQPDGPRAIGLRRPLPCRIKGGLEGPLSGPVSAWQVMAAALAEQHVGLPQGRIGGTRWCCCVRFELCPHHQLTGVAGQSGRGRGSRLGSPPASRPEGPADDRFEAARRAESDRLDHIVRSPPPRVGLSSQRVNTAPPVRRLNRRLGTICAPGRGPEQQGGRDQKRCRPPGRCRAVRRSRNAPPARCAGQ